MEVLPVRTLLTEPMRLLLQKPLLSQAEVGDVLGVSVQTIGRMLKRRELEAVKIGRSVRILSESLERYLRKETNHV
jgi:excisionase family DNA binding protein